MNLMLSIPIIYEDNHLLVVEKPVNVLSQADRTGDPDMLTLLKQDLKERYNKPGNVYLGLVHRLDRPVGGVMVFAKTSKAAGRLSKQFVDGSFEKIYLAVVHGRPKKSAGQLVHYLKKDRELNKVAASAGEVSGSRKAVLNYQVLESQKGCSLVRIELITGRPHQIRAQFAAEGTPLIGDQKYGIPTKDHVQIALWSCQVGFSHPTLKEWMTFKLLPPTRLYPWNQFNWDY
mgnify:FL=1|jgi:23S rRNA pseudouridine1911/1915/1917 synthase